MSTAVLHPLLSPVLCLLGHSALSPKLTISVSPRLTRSLATSTPARYEIRLRPDVLEAPKPLLEEILTHELAHIIVAHHHPGAKPHGPEWQALMRRAGYEPRTQVPFPTSSPRSKAYSPKWDYLHTCPVCQSVRKAKRRMPNWRCRPCTEAGLAGILTVTRRRR